MGVWSKTLPQGWEIVRVKDIFKVTRGKVLAVPKMKQVKSEEYVYPVFSSQTANNGLTGFYTEYLFENAITWTTDGHYAGDVNFRQGKFYCTNVCGVLLNNEGYANRCVAEILNAQTKKYVTYAGNPKLMNNVMAEIPILLPPLEEQEKIAEILNLWDAQIAEVQDLIHHKQRLKTGLMQKLLTQSLRLKGFAESWSKVRLGDIAEIKRGQTITEATRIDGDIPVIAGGKQPAYFCDRYNRTGENITISSSGTAGFVNYFATPIFASDCFTIQGLEKLAITKYLYYYLKSIQNKIYSLQSGSVQTHVYPSDMEGMRLPLPSLKEQEKIAEILSVADEEIELLVQKHQALETQKRALMQRLLTGKVRV